MCSARSVSRTGASTAPRSSPAASSSASRSPGRSYRPSVMFADEPTGNLDSRTGAEILDVLRGSVRTTGRRTVMVTHDARAAATADRILFLADGASSRSCVAPTSIRSSLRSRRSRCDDRVALRGLAGRKLRTALTAVAIVLGVAMMSGAYVLTDTIDKAFDKIFVESYANTDAVDGQGVRHQLRGRAAPPARSPRASSSRSGPVDGVEVAAGTVQDHEAGQQDGKAINTEGAPTFAVGVDPRPSSPNSIRSTSSKAAGRKAGEVAIVERRGRGGIGPGDGPASRRSGRQEFEIVGLATYGDLSRSAARRSPSRSRSSGAARARTRSTRCDRGEGRRAARELVRRSARRS